MGKLVVFAAKEAEIVKAAPAPKEKKEKKKDAPAAKEKKAAPD